MGARTFRVALWTRKKLGTGERRGAREEDRSQERLECAVLNSGSGRLTSCVTWKRDRGAGENISPVSCSAVAHSLKGPSVEPGAQSV